MVLDVHAAKKAGKYGDVGIASSVQRDGPEGLFVVERIFGSMHAPPMPAPEAFNPCCILIPLPLKLALLHLSHFFSLRLVAEVVKHNVEDGSMLLNGYDNFLSFLIWINIFTTGSECVVIEIQRASSGGHVLMSKILNDLKQFLADRIEKDTQDEVLDLVHESAKSERMENEKLDIDATAHEIRRIAPSIPQAFPERVETCTAACLLDISDQVNVCSITSLRDCNIGGDDGFHVDTPTKCEWLCAMQDVEDAQASKDEEVTSFCEMGLSYRSDELGALSEVITTSFLNCCWDSFPVYTVLKLLAHMAQEPSIAYTLLPKIDFSKIPVFDAIIAQEIVDTLLTLVSSVQFGYDFPDFLRADILKQVQRFQDDDRFGKHHESQFREITFLLTQFR